jgi:TetR/AcrR family transcriptional regulator
MPHQTFHNLKKERQEEILQVAYREFILNDYRSASLSRIIKQLNLAKGSFYRYFSSKKDLYHYLLEQSTRERFDTLDKRLMDPDMDLYRLIRINWQDKIEFEINHPLESAFQYRVFRERYNEDLGDMEIRIKRELLEKIRDLIRQRFLGSIRNDIELDMIIYHIIQVQVGMYDYLAIRFGDDLLENIKNGKPLYLLHKEEFIQLIEEFSELVENGISNKNQKP